MILAGAGGVPRRVLLEDAWDIAEMMVALGRLVPADRWVDSLRDVRQSQSLDSLGAC